MIKENIENVILFQIDKTSKVAKQYSQQELDKAGLEITVEQWVVLKTIEESQQLSQKELADQLTRDPASITRTLDLLEKKQFIQREQIPNNRRQYNIRLTATGGEFVKANMKMISSLRKRSINGFSDLEIQSLTSMLLRIQKNMS